MTTDLRDSNPDRLMEIFTSPDEVKQVAKDLAKTVADQVTGSALQWWEANKAELADMAEAEAYAIFEALQRGDTLEAKMEIVGHMDRDEWLAYRRATTKSLEGVATRRHKLVRAVETITVQTARIIGAAVVGAIRNR